MRHIFSLICQDILRIYRQYFFHWIIGKTYFLLGGLLLIVLFMLACEIFNVLAGNLSSPIWIELFKTLKAIGDLLGMIFGLTFICIACIFLMLGYIQHKSTSVSKMNILKTFGEMKLLRLACCPLILIPIIGVVAFYHIYETILGMVLLAVACIGVFLFMVRVIFLYWIVCDVKNFPDIGILKAGKVSWQMTQKYVVPLTGILFCAGGLCFGIDAIVTWGSTLFIQNEIIRILVLVIYTILTTGTFIIVVTTLYDFLLQKAGYQSLRISGEEPTLETPK